MHDSESVIISINGKSVRARSGTSILEAARGAGVAIPSLCNHGDVPPAASCRLCMVAVKGIGLVPSCATVVREGMEIETETTEIVRTRKTNLELVFGQHRLECADCVSQHHCTLRSLAKTYHPNAGRYAGRLAKSVQKFGGVLEFDRSKCVNCRLCVAVCAKQGIGCLSVNQDDGTIQVSPDGRGENPCVSCGQCIVHCPVGAIESVGEFEGVETPLQDPQKTVVFQVAPSVRVTAGEEFGLPPGTNVAGRLAAAIRMLGVDAVFDVAVGADFTTMAEAGEFIERLQGRNGLPMFTSCCPAWVRFVEIYAPEHIPNLTTVRSPHIIMGSVVKSYWARAAGKDPRDITVVSVMPCVAKKYEIMRPELAVNGIRPVDYVLTVRELAVLLLRHGINLARMTDEEYDDPLGAPTGSGIGYGYGGGVMESALRTVAAQSGQYMGNVEFERVPGVSGVKESSIMLGSHEVRVAVVEGLGAARHVLGALQRREAQYDYVEVMACPGGCIGGGGQPVLADTGIRAARTQALRHISRGVPRFEAGESPAVQKIIQSYSKDRVWWHSINHTSYQPARVSVRASFE